MSPSRARADLIDYRLAVGTDCGGSLTKGYGVKPGTNYVERSRQAAAADARESLYRQAEQLMAERVAVATAGAHAKPCTCGHSWEEHEDDEGCLHGWGDLEEVEPCFCERR